SEECTINLMGDIYVKGRISFDDETQVYVDNSVGTTPPVIVANGSIVLGDSTLNVNASQTGATFISFLSSDSVCSDSPSCNMLDSPSKLQSSQGIRAINIDSDIRFRDVTVWA